jgi:hypothetical protein
MQQNVMEVAQPQHVTQGTQVSVGTICEHALCSELGGVLGSPVPSR